MRVFEGAVSHSGEEGILKAVPKYRMIFANSEDTVAAVVAVGKDLWDCDVLFNGRIISKSQVT